MSGPGCAAEDALARAAGVLAAGQVLAVKGLGGYHLAVDAASDQAAARLRSRKHREDKPFAVMAADLATVRALCEVEATAECVLRVKGSVAPAAATIRRSDYPWQVKRQAPPD